MNHHHHHQQQEEEDPKCRADTSHSCSVNACSSSSNSNNDRDTMNKHLQKLILPPNPKDSFPARLHQMLTDIDLLSEKEEGMKQLREYVSWMDHGESFKIHKKKEFEALVMPVWFNRLKCNSFLRQLSLYGFVRSHKTGVERGAWSHPNFRRDKPELTSAIERLDRAKRKNKAAGPLILPSMETPAANKSNTDEPAPNKKQGPPVPNWQEVPGNEDILSELCFAVPLQTNSNTHQTNKNDKLTTRYSSNNHNHINHNIHNNTMNTTLHNQGQDNNNNTNKTAGTGTGTTQLRLQGATAAFLQSLPLQGQVNYGKDNQTHLHHAQHPHQKQSIQPDLLRRFQPLAAACNQRQVQTQAQSYSLQECLTRSSHTPASITNTNSNTKTNTPEYNPFLMGLAAGLEPTPIAEQCWQQQPQPPRHQQQQHQQQQFHPFDIEPLRVFKTDHSSRSSS